ncbi:Cro/CI family transcriptional regulator [Escherichia coli]|uniref:Cro/CI family transcriptional regulator n=1 Tax=Escherichia coli TaxID=562 RepID=UPI000B7F3C5D|nr:Cro/CI family transcriptional regulator [Escherichia coli]
MYKKDVIDHFGTQRAVAKALGISDAAVSQWKEVMGLGFKLVVVCDDNTQDYPTKTDLGGLSHLLVSTE